MPSIRRPITSTSVVFTTIVLLTGAAFARDQPLTAREVIARIQQQVGVPWQSDTVDTFKAGNPDTPVTGIAVTMMATLDVLQRAAAAGDNLVITHEPTFFDHLDNSDQLPEKDNDPVLVEKRQFIEKHGLVIWRFHDHWHARTPDGIEAGMVHALGWEKFQDPQNQYLFNMPEISLEKLASEIKRKLGIHVMRVVGDPGLRITKLAFSPGAAGFTTHAQALEMAGVQALVIGEAREWETVEYVADAVSEGKQKSLIILSHIPSEQAGMEECTRWLKAFVTGVPIQFIPAREPFWSPKP
ncbi:MAG: Nif3-like dinuclear metal center hexameric protein [Terriglobales bacterium]